MDFVIRNILTSQSDFSSSVDEDNRECRDKLWWIAPPAGFTKLNVDGSFSPLTGMMRFGRVMRDSEGAWLWGFSATGGIGSVIEAEIWALITGLQFAWDKEYRKVHCETDSLEVIHMLNHDPSSLFGQTKRLLEQLKYLLSRPWEIRVSHVFREANMIADYLAHFNSRSSEGVAVLDQPPSQILDLLA
ncbi:Ribonuclease H domain [Sesbania bispinosa]|nr:Ribonuclease H domain [Sesbania bispinosa]